MYQLIGYIASIFLAISLVINGAIKFRIFNMLGQIAFIVYGIVINAFPIIVANSALLCINIYQLYKLSQSNEQFKYVPIEPNNKIIEEFLAFYKTDISNYFPQFKYMPTLQQQINFVVLRNASIANIFVATIDTKGNATVHINYTIPQYRDYKVGRFIFEKEKKYLQANNIKNVVYTQVHNKQHLEFLQVMGFTQQQINGQSCWVKNLN